METYSFGEWVKQRREGLRLTQRELATRVHCSVATIKKIEADERRPSPEMAGLLAGSLSIPEVDRPVFLQVARGERSADGLWNMQEGSRGDASDAATIPLPSHAPAPLPVPATPFIGRADELEAVTGRLANPECRLLTLVGPGGVGKTRLALAAAGMVSNPATGAEAVPGASAFVSLAALGDTHSIPEAVARSLHLILSGPPAEQVAAYLRRLSLLLILDNCEQLVGDLSWLSDLLAHAPGVKLLATSRERLHLAEEWVYVVPDLAQAEALFAETARRVKQDFDVGAEQAAILRICRLVQNLPLAVELAASWTPVMSCEQIADYIQRDIHILEADVRNAPDRHRSIQAVFDHSWNLLNSAEQNALMRLSVFRGGWQVEEAQEVAGANLLMLRRLADKSLVRVGENGRFDLHGLVCQYAAEKLAQSGRDNETHRRHCDAILALTMRLDAQQYSPQALAAVSRFDQELDNIRAALGWSLEEGQTEVALNLLNHLWFYWQRRGFFYEGAEWFTRVTDQIIHQAGEKESVPLSVALSSATVMFAIQGRFDEAEALARRAVDMARRLKDPQALIAAAGTYTFTSTRAAQALEELSRGISLIQETGKMQELLPLLYLGSATWLHSSGHYAEAEAYYRKGIELFRQLGIVDFTSEPLGRLGQLALQEGRLQEAYDLTVESIDASRVGGCAIVFSAWGNARLGLIQLYQGQVDAAQRNLEEALQFYEDVPSYQRPKQEALAVLSEVALARGDVNAAGDYLQASLKICEMFYQHLRGSHILAGTPEALPLDFIGLCARASLVAAAQGKDERAVTLYSIADSLCLQSGQLMIPPLRARLDESMVALRARVGETHFDAAWETGQKMPLSEAFAFLLA